MKPILFSTPMVQAILDGRKTQTRRAQGLKEVDANEFYFDRRVGDQFVFVSKTNPNNQLFITPKYVEGDVLWVRETWFNDADFGEKPIFIYKADNENFPRGSSPWKPSIFMPKEAARIFQFVTGVRVERLQEITGEDAIAEGVEPIGNHKHLNCMIYKNYGPEIYQFLSPKKSFESLWKSINGEDSWNENPWVWVYEFERIEKPVK